jgi:hypothetical protein
MAMVELGWETSQALRYPAPPRPVPVDGAATERARSHARAARLAWWLDSAFRIPGTRLRIGLDPVIGLVPGLGDAASALLSAWVIREAWRVGIPKSALLRMIGNVMVDTALGAVPLLGDAADVLWKANRRNLTILQDHLRRSAATPVKRAGRPQP